MPVEARRILSLVFPQLLCELWDGDRRDDRLSLTSPQENTARPLAVVLLPERETETLKPQDRLTAVCPMAHRLGIRPGQKTQEACALVAGLRIEAINQAKVLERLRYVAEVANRYGSSLCWQVPDTIWLDVTGVGHLFGGEESLAVEVQEQIRSLGHLVRAVIAPGPRIGQALGRFLPRPTLVVPRERASAQMRELPLTALPLASDHIEWFARLGIYSVGQLADLPAKTLATRLGPQAGRILELTRGIDPTPLVPEPLPQILEESVKWEDPISGLSPLLFALRGLVARLSARLEGRGEAALFLECEVEHDRAMARHQGMLPRTLFEFELASPLFREQDFERVVKSRLEKSRWGAPSVGVTLRASQLTPQIMSQVRLAARGEAFFVKPEPEQELSVLLAELQSDVGREGLGVLATKDSLLPEECSSLLPVTSTGKGRHKKAKKRESRKATSLLPYPTLNKVTRLFSQPLPLQGAARVGEHFGLGTEWYTIRKLSFVTRLEGVYWWTEQVTRRDYFWAHLEGLRGHGEALLFIDKTNGRLHLQGWGD